MAVAIRPDGQGDHEGSNVTRLSSRALQEYHEPTPLAASALLHPLPGLRRGVRMMIGALRYRDPREGLHVTGNARSAQHQDAG